MAFVDSFPSVLELLADHLARRFKIVAVVAGVLILAAIGTWIAGQYQIGKLDEVSGKYNAALTDYAASFASAKPESVERDVLEACKQSQIGSWLQTTDALQFKDPISGNRVLVELDPSRGFIDLNGREISICVQDEIENRQFDISAMTFNWAGVLMILGALIGGASFYGYRRIHPKPVPQVVDVVAEPVEPLQRPDALMSESPTPNDPESESR